LTYFKTSNDNGIRKVKLIKKMFSLFLPVYNEERDLERNVEEIIKALGGMDFELFIVDDVSGDGTPTIGKRLAAEDPRVKYLRYEGTRPTRRENLAQSFKKASGDVIGFIDADLSASPAYLPEMVGKMPEADLVIGNRRHPQSETKRSLYRYTVSGLYTEFVKHYFGVEIKDFQCGLKVFRRDVILRLVEEAGYDDKAVRNFAWDVEILLRAKKKGYRIVEIPVKWVESNRTSTRAFRDMRMIPYLFGLKSRL